MDILYRSIDHASCAVVDEAIVTNLVIDWTIDFEQKVLSGSVKQNIRILRDNVMTVNFDTSSLHITSITILASTVSKDFIPTTYSLSSVTTAFGNKLSVDIPESVRTKDSEFEIMIEYSTSTDASAVQWLNPSATAGGIYPYVFTQCQAIHARSLLPCMDTPAIKTTYSATVRCPEWCTVLMSALKDDANSSVGVFKYHQPVAIPVYLIALAAGQLESADISPRVRVWSEPTIVPSAAFEFSQTEEFVATAESLAGPYVWGRYDVLCLPPSFPYGGMENPCLTFATPTLLAGDKSLADVIAHEIAHSWTGNLVTNATWAHFWLNEGWTTWLERKIIARVHGANGLEHLKLSAQIGYEFLKESVSKLSGSDNDAQGMTQLVIPYVDQHPDDAFSSVPYEKGFALLYYLENQVGSESFEGFFKAYVDNFKFKTVTTGTFRDYFLQYFAPWDSETVTKIAAIDWNLWFTGRGMPPISHDFNNSLSTVAKQLGALWLDAMANGKEAPDFTFFKPSISDWNSAQTCIFLDILLTGTDPSSPDGDDPITITEPSLKALDTHYNFTQSKNAEIKFRWLKLALRGEAEWIVEPAVAFVTSQGRMKYVRPLYRAIRLANVSAEVAVATFNKYNQMYHPIARKLIATDFTAIQAQADSEV